MLPRGGTCASCGNYTLWGDIVKGCFRRHTGRVILDNQEEGDEEEDDEGVQELEEAEGVKEQEELEILSDIDSDSDLACSKTDSGLRATRSRSRSPSDPKRLAGNLNLLTLEDSTSRASGRGRPSTKKTETKARKAGETAKSKGEAKRGATLSTTATLRSARPTASAALPSRGRGRPKKGVLTGEPEPGLESSNAGAMTSPRKDEESSSDPLVPVVEPLISKSVRRALEISTKQAPLLGLSPSCLPSPGGRSDVGSASPAATTKRLRTRKQPEAIPVTAPNPLSTTLPRRRGRPRKAPSSTFVNDLPPSEPLEPPAELLQPDLSLSPELDQISDSKPQPESEQHSSLMIPRKRGSRSPKQQSVATTIPSDTTSKPEAPSPTPVTPKRPRGRPRKNVTQSSASTMADGCTLSVRRNKESNGLGESGGETFEVQVTASTPSRTGTGAGRNIKPLSIMGSPVKRGRGRPRRSSVESAEKVEVDEGT